MTRERTKELLPIMEAYANGEKYICYYTIKSNINTN